MSRIRCPCGNTLVDISDASPDVVGELFTRAEIEMWAGDPTKTGEDVMSCRECGRIVFCGNAEGRAQPARWYVAEAAFQGLRALLREVEWKGIDGGCPLCGPDYHVPGPNPYAGKHTPSCRLAADLK